MPYAIVNSVCAQVYSQDIPGAGGRYFPTDEEAQVACDEYNKIHAPAAWERDHIDEYNVEVE